VCGAQLITAPTSNWRGRGNIKFCIFKKPLSVNEDGVSKRQLLVAAKRYLQA